MVDNKTGKILAIIGVLGGVGVGLYLLLKPSSASAATTVAKLGSSVKTNTAMTPAQLAQVRQTALNNQKAAAANPTNNALASLLKGLTSKPTTSSTKPSPNKPSSGGASMGSGGGGTQSGGASKPSASKPPKATTPPVAPAQPASQVNSGSMKDNGNGTYTDESGNLYDGNTGELLGHDNGDGSMTDASGNIYDTQSGDFVGWDNGDGTWTDASTGEITDDQTGDVVGIDNGDGTWTDTTTGEITDDITGEVVGLTDYAAAGVYAQNYGDSSSASSGYGATSAGYDVTSQNSNDQAAQAYYGNYQTSNDQYTSSNDYSSQYAYSSY